MKKINFKKITIKNFLSFGETPVELEFKKGLHIITGINRDKQDRQNGIGKSAMMESLYFAIFGTTIRELKKDLICNTNTNGTCEVVLDFEVKSENKTEYYKVVRTLNPSKLYFYKDNTDITRDSIKNTEEVLHNILHATPSIFENCVIMTLNNTIPFMAKSKIDKRKFIEGIFNLDIFSKMLSVVREEYNETKREYEIELTKMEDSDKTLNSLNLQKTNILNNRKNKLVTYEKRKVDNIVEKEKLLNEIKEDLEGSITKIKEDIKKLKKFKDDEEKEISKLNEEKYKLSSEIIQQETNYKKIGTSDESCPVCLRSIEEHDKNLIKEEKIKIKNSIESNKEKLKNIVDTLEAKKTSKKKVENTIDRYNSKLNDFIVNQKKQENTNIRIQQLDSWLNQLDEDIQELKSDFTDVDGLINEQIFFLEDLKETVNSCRFKLNLMDTVKFIVSEEGVKSYIVKKILLMFNDKIRHYLSRLDANCICNFNEYFEEEIVNDKNKTCSYFNFSGAERKNIDFACLFTFMDMRRLQGDVTYNISIYDELFDSCLDDKGLNLITNIINERVDKYDECVLVISHRKESVKAATGDVIFLEKKNGITNRINYNPFI
jgi:DNA repair exonuclease SbcCD ATPase subunit